MGAFWDRVVTAVAGVKFGNLSWARKGGPLETMARQLHMFWPDPEMGEVGISQQVVRDVLLSPSLFSYLIPCIIKMGIVMKSYMMRVFVRHKCAAFLAKLSAELSKHASWAFKLFRREPLKAKAQAVSVEEDANTWGAVWHESLESRALPYACSRLKELTTSGKVGPKISCVSVKVFRYAAKHYSARKALGIDGWRPAELARLPDRCLGMFVRCINQYVMTGSYDEYLCVSIMALFAKPQGGFRCVAK